MKKLVCLLMAALVFVTMFSAMTLTVFASTGECGNNGNVHWELNGTTLRIYGQGSMDNYDDWDKSPWYSTYKKTEKLIVEDGITSIGNYAFSYFYNLNEISIGKDVKKIGEYAFYYATWYHAGGVNLVLPEGLEKIEDYAFAYAHGLENVNIKSDNIEIGYEAFYLCKYVKNLAVGSLNETVGKHIYVGESAFENLNSLENVYFSNALRSLENLAFEDCRAIKNFYYGGTEYDFTGVRVYAENDHLTNAKRYWSKDFIEYNMSLYDRTRFTYSVKIKDLVFLKAPFSLGGTYEGNMIYIKMQPICSDKYYHWRELPDGTTIKRDLHTGEPVNSFRPCTYCGTKTAMYICPIFCDENNHTITVRNFRKEKGSKYLVDAPYYFLTDFIAGKENEKEILLDKDGFFIVDTQFDFGDKRVTIDGDVRLILLNYCGITTSKGILVKSDKKLSVYTAMGPATDNSYIKVTGAPEDYAGIGGEPDCKATIGLYGSNIEAHAGTNGAGIGSAKGGNVKLDIANVPSLRAFGQNGGAGIGAGSGGSCEVTIRRNMVFSMDIKAYAGETAAGIGGGFSSSGCTAKVEIRDNGGAGGELDIEAYASAGAGIGSGSNNLSDVYVDIYGGHIHACSNRRIKLDSYGNVEISNYFPIGGNIEILMCGAGIGNGAVDSDSAKSIHKYTIHGGVVYAETHSYAAAIGNGVHDFTSCEVILEGGELHIDTPRKIGSSGDSGEVTVIIKGDKVTLNGEKLTQEIYNTKYATGSVLSEGSLWIVIAVAVVALGGVAALVIVKKKKKKPALAGGTDNTDEE